MAPPQRCLRETAPWSCSDEWDLDLLVPPGLPDDVADICVVTSMQPFARSRTARFRRSHVDHLRVQASQ